MWLLLAIGIGFSCDLEGFENCLGNGKRATKCINTNNCVEKEIEVKVVSNKLIIKGFFVNPEDKFEIGELIGCDLTSYELCFSLAEKEVISCLKKIECIEFIIISELREENYYFDFANYNHYANNEEAASKTVQNDQGNTKDIFSEYNYIWEKMLDEKNKENENEGDQDGDFEQANSFEMDESEEIDSFFMVVSQENDENIEVEFMKDGENEQGYNFVNDKNHINQDSDKFLNDLWKIEQEIVDKEKKSKEPTKSNLDELSLSQIGDKIQFVYDEWEKAKDAKGTDRLQFDWMMDNNGEIKDLDVLLEELYIVYRKKLHEMMEEQEKNKQGETEDIMKDEHHSKNTEKTISNQDKNTKKSDELLSSIKSTLKNKENTPIKNLENYSESPQDAVIDLFNKESDFEVYNRIEKGNTIASEEKESDTNKENHQTKQENNFVDAEELATSQEEFEVFNTKTIDFVNESGLEPNINDQEIEEDEDQLLDIEEEKLDQKITSFTIETDDDSYLSSEKNHGFLYAKSQDSNSCEKSCETRCLTEKNDECLSTCLSSMCSTPSKRSDYFVVIITGLFLFCIVSIIYLFMKNRDIRIGYQDYIKGHTS